MSKYEKSRGLTVEVRGNIEKAIKLLGRKVKQEGLIREIRERQYYEKPSTVKRKNKAAAIRRAKRNKTTEE